MKTTLPNLLKYTLIITIIISFTSCEQKTKWEKMGYPSYTEYTVADFNTLKSPVILIGKVLNLGDYSIVVKDANGTVRYYGNMSYMASALGHSHNVGDTLK
jgi:hypothetical protein